MMALMHYAGCEGLLRLKLEARATDMGKPNAALQKKLLGPFKEIFHGAYLTAPLEGEVTPPTLKKSSQP